MHDEAIKDFNIVIKSEKNNSHAYFRRGFSYKALEYIDKSYLMKASKDWNKAVKLDPGNILLRINPIKIYDCEVIQLVKSGFEPDFIK